MMTRVSILSENSVAEPYGIIGEHGFSAFVETADSNFLFDTGQGKVLMNNCFIMGKNLGSIKFLVLSHGHYDHTSGLPDVLSKKSPLDVYCHPDVFSERYWAHGDSKSKFVGIPFRREYLESLGANFRFVREFVELDKGIYLTGEVPQNIPPEFGDHMEIVDENGRHIKDPLLDDFTIAIDTKKGLLILLGCAHAGLVNIISFNGSSLINLALRMLKSSPQVTIPPMQIYQVGMVPSSGLLPGKDLLQWIYYVS